MVVATMSSMTVKPSSSSLPATNRARKTDMAEGSTTLRVGLSRSA